MSGSQWSPTVPTPACISMKSSFSKKTKGTRLKYLQTILFTTALLFSMSTHAEESLAIVPWPKLVQNTGRTAMLKPVISIDDASLKPLAEVLAENISKATSLNCKVATRPVGSGITFKIDNNLTKDTYRLEVNNSSAVIKAGGYQGFVYGTATLIQIVKKEKHQLSFPVVTIEDTPDYPFRSVMVDTARFWNPIQILKEAVDLSYFYKFNYMHLHLTDDQSFTFPSKVIPQAKSYFRDGTRRHYTLEELKDLVEYARVRGIAIIPEVDVPGHAGVLANAMPEVFGMKDPKTGKFRVLGNVVNMANEATYEKLDALFAEVADVFRTSPYIHIGADEVNAGAMKQLPEYIPYCEKHGLTEAVNGNAGELYAHFVVRMNDIIKKHGKQMVAWEGFHGTGTENARVPTDVLMMAWNNTFNPPGQLLKNGYTVINASWKPMYIVPPQNYMDSQEDTYAWDVYDFADRSSDVPYQRMPKDSDVIGAQICYWEQTYEAVFPALRKHIPVVSERIWNQNAGRTFTDFQERFGQTDCLAGQLNRPVQMNVEGLLPDSKGSIRFDKQVTIHLNSEIDGTIRYRLDDEWGRFPDATSTVYTQPFTLDDSKVVTAGLFDADNNLISYYSQQKYSKITPAYKYRVLRPVPEGGWSTFPDFSTLTETRTGVMGYADAQRMQELNRVMFAKPNPYGHIDTQPFEETNAFAMELIGQIKIPEAGQYLFQIQSPFGQARVYIGDTCIAKYEGSGKGTTTGKLEAGVYPFRIEYFYTKVMNFLNVQMKLDSQDKLQPFGQYVLPIAEWTSPEQLKKIPVGTEFGRHIEEQYMSLATNKPVTCSGGTQGPNVPENAVDGDVSNGSGWHSGSSPQWLRVDLQDIYTIDRIKLYTYYDNHRHYCYFIEVSTDGKQYTEVVDQRGNTVPSSQQGFEHRIDPVRARYVRVTMVSNSANPGVHINEILVYGKKEAQVKNDNPQPIVIENFQEGEVVRYPVPLIRGQLDDAVEKLTVTNTTPGADPTAVPADVYQGRFRVLTELIPGTNRLLIEAGKEKKYLTLEYKPQTNPYKVRFFYVTDNTGQTDYISPLSNDPQNFRQKMDVAAKLMQSFAADSMYRYGYGRKTFNLELDDAGKLIVHVVESPNPRTYFHENSSFKWYGHINHIIQKEYPTGEFYLNMGIANVTEFDPVAKQVVGGVALGSPSLALFGSGALYTWPNSVSDTIRAFSDAAVMDPDKEFDDSAGRSTRWANASTSIGAIMHECGHGFGLPHSKDGLAIMNRGFDHLNRVFCYHEPPSRWSKTERAYAGTDKAAHWSKGYAAFLNHSRYFQMDQREYPSNDSPRLEVNEDGLEIAVQSDNGIQWTAVFNFNNGDLYLDDKDFTAYSEPLPKEVQFSVSEIQKQVGDEKFSIVAVDSLGNRKDFHPRDMKSK